MYKKNSENAQIRERRIALQSKKNTAGVDETAFSTEEILNERYMLNHRQKELEFHLTELKAMMTNAQTHRVSDATWSNWIKRKANLVKEFQDLQIRVVRLKQASVLKNLARDENFEQAFVACAREMLVDEIFNRVVQAAILRCRAGHEPHRS